MSSSSKCIILFLLTIVGHSQGKKNILFIGLDDLRPNLGCYSERNAGVYNSAPMVTPNIDKLSESSALFESAYVQQSVCSPSRTSMLTGRRPDTTHIIDLKSYFRTIGGNFTTIPQFFKENGYKSVNIGKMFHASVAASGGDDPPSWDEIYHAQGTYPTSQYNESWKAVAEDILEETPLIDTAEADYTMQKMEELAPNALLGVEPFFLAWGLHRPHLPFTFPESFLDFYPVESVTLPSNPYVPEDMPDTAWSNWGELLDHHYQDFNTEDPENGLESDLGQINVTLPDWKTLDMRRAYYAAITYVDYEIGRVLNQLEVLGLAENTIVVLWGDHGWQLGEHSEWCKHTLFEIANRAPLIIKVPGLTDAGVRVQKPVEFVDIFPTLVELADFPHLELCPQLSNETELCTEGSSLLPLLSDPSYDLWKSAVFWQFPRPMGCYIENHIPCSMGYSVLSGKYRYTEYVKIINLGANNYTPDWESMIDHEELYDQELDPQENRNM